ncbi:hypothetical protein Tco_0114643, partial [Tanacetum coccineum]
RGGWWRRRVVAGGAVVVMMMMEVVGDDGVGCGGTAAGEEGEGKTRVRASEYDARVDPVVRNLFGFGRKNPPEKFFDGG